MPLASLATWLLCLPSLVLIYYLSKYVFVFVDVWENSRWGEGLAVSSSGHLQRLPGKIGEDGLLWFVLTEIVCMKSQFRIIDNIF